LNNRTHRKLLTVDGQIGFTGGVGIADEWPGSAQDENHWRDTHFRAEGPVVGQMQAVFMDNWTKTTGAVLHGDAYFPAPTAVGRERGQTFMSSPNGGAESMHLMYLLALTAASRSIHLSMAYFVPDDLALRTLVAALKRGVKVQIIMPSPTAMNHVRRITCSLGRVAGDRGSGFPPPLSTRMSRWYALVHRCTDRVERGAKSSDKCPHRQPRTRGLRRLFAAFANQGLRCK
jgi:hypothetical protein